MTWLRRWTVRLPMLGLALAAGSTMLACQTPPPRRELVPRMHQEAIVRPGEEAQAVVVGAATPFSACVQAETREDIRQWRGRLQIDEESGPEIEPEVRFQGTACFPVQVGRLSDGQHSVCLSLVDGFDESQVGVGCLSFVYRDADPTWEALEGERQVLSRRVGSAPPAELARRLLELSERAGASGYPILALRTRLIASHQLRRDGTSQSLAIARELVEPRGEEGRSVALLQWNTQRLIERAIVRSASGESQIASWQDLRLAQRASERIVDPRRLGLVFQQGQVLGRVNALREAAVRLSAALESCAFAPCMEYLKPPAESSLSWALLMDPSNSLETRLAARSRVEQSLEGSERMPDPLEVVNSLINLAYADTLLGRDPRVVTLTARELVGSPMGKFSFAAELLGWLDTVEGVAAANRGDLESALRLCTAGTKNVAPQVAAMGWSCLAQIEQRKGSLDRALEFLNRALAEHNKQSPDSETSWFEIGSAQRGVDLMAAARVAALLGRGDQAWALLSEGSEPTARQLGGEASVLLERFAELQPPISLKHGTAATDAANRLRQELVETLRSSPPPASQTSRATQPDLRAFQSGGEILVLQREPSGAAHLLRRTVYAERELSELLAPLEGAHDGRQITDQVWRERALILARAISPGSSCAQTTCTLALHGELQSVPLFALPLPDEDRGDGPAHDFAWFGTRYRLAIVPQGARQNAAGDVGDQRFLFVVDPQRNLASGELAAVSYLSEFPGAVVLHGGEATRDAVKRELRVAALAHFDTHGDFDAAFPQLSALRLADGPLLSVDFLGAGQLQVVNLSSCGSSRWPTTADAGGFGVAGELTRIGVRWVIGASKDLDDRVAAAFNRAFYESMGAGASVPDAFRDGLRTVAARFRVTDWAPIQLFFAPGNESAESEPGLTPLQHDGSLGQAVNDRRMGGADRGRSN